VAALTAVAVNGCLVVALHGHGHRHDLNFRAAVLHVVSDLAAGVGVVAAGLLILWTGWLYADPLVSLAICGLIAAGAFRMLREAANVLLEGAPHGVELAAVRHVLLAGDGVRSVHDLHVWSVSPEHAALSAHLVVDPQSLAAGEHLVRSLEGRLCQTFGIGHTTIQLETCHPCEEDVGHAATEHNHPHG
jgi:cobalt-zinc-cadmium efflux system protein